MDIIGYEIDFLPVGEESSSGDTILFRYKEDDSDFCKVILIDGGYKKSGDVKTSETILEHLREYYFPNVQEDKKMCIEHIICSHPDSDHLGALEEIMEECNVGTFWINDPREFAKNSNLAETAYIAKFAEAHAKTVENLIKVARKNDVEVKCPIQGKCIGPLSVASPSKEFYDSLFKNELTPQEDEKENSLKEGKNSTKMIKACWTKDELFELPETSVCNETSTVLFGLLTKDQEKVLLTADAGVRALTEAHTYLKGKFNFRAGTLCFMQMPHHGGRQNVNSAVLDLLLGKKIPEESNEEIGLSFASVAKEAEGYPKNAVTNAFTTRGYSCSATKGESICYRGGKMKDRDGWTSLTPISFSDIVEKLD